MARSISVEQLEEIVTLLKPFKEVTVMMSTEQSSTISLICPILIQLMEVCKPVPNVDSTIIHTAKAAIYHDMETR